MSGFPIWHRHDLRIARSDAAIVPDRLRRGRTHFCTGGAMGRAGPRLRHQDERGGDPLCQAYRISRASPSRLRDIERSEEPTSELQYLMSISYAVCCVQTKVQKI